MKCGNTLHKVIFADARKRFLPVLAVAFGIYAMMELYYLIPFFFLIAAAYGAAGLGGGSSYLALLTLAGLTLPELRSLALLCNLAVVSGSVYVFFRAGYLHWRSALPLVVISIPMAFLGGLWQLTEAYYFLLLGGTLLLAALAMWAQPTQRVKRFPFSVNVVVGGVIGGLSGLVGIGGGIFLSPLLHLSNWATPKTIAATTAFFIFGNSLSGLAGQWFGPGFTWAPIPTGLLLFAVVGGGQLGVRWSVLRADGRWLRRLTAALIFFVAIRLLFQYVPQLLNS